MEAIKGDNFEARFAQVLAISGPTWFRQPTLVPDDDRWSALMRGLAALPPAERDARAAPFRDPKFQDIVEAFAQRMAVHAVRVGSTERLRDGGLALALHGRFTRDILPKLALVRHSAGKLGLDGDAFLRECATFAAPGRAEWILNYVTSKQKSIESFNWHEVEGPDGFDYKVW